MSLKDIHKEQVLEEIHKSYLKDGIIPTAAMIKESLEEYLASHPDLEVPISKGINLAVDRGSSSSFSLIQQSAELFSSDLSIVTKEIYRLSLTGEEFHDRWISEVNRLNKYSRELEDRVDSLLLLAYDTVGFFAHVGDTFPSMNKIDTVETSAKVDLSSTAITINPETAIANGELGTSVNLNNMTEEDVVFYPLTKAPRTTQKTISDNGSLKNIFRVNTSEWVNQITSSTRQMVTELKARLHPSIKHDISQISLSYTGPNNSTKNTITAMYSENGYEWFLVPCPEATKSLMVGNISWFFAEKEINWLKFIIRKDAPDQVIDSSNVFEYAIRNISVYRRNYNSISGGNIFVSKSLHALDLIEEPIVFSLVSLDACEELPENTDIKYYLSASSDEVTWSDWTQVAPTEREAGTVPKLINFGGIDWQSNIEQSLEDSVLFNTDLDGTTGTMKLTSTFNNSSLPGLTGYRFKQGTYGVVNTAIVPPPETSSELSENNIIVWRNVRNKNYYDFPEAYPDLETVRKTPRGWGKRGSSYSCYFEIIDSAGRNLDFGDTFCAIDGEEATGVIRVSQGVHKFETEASNWEDIAQSIVDYGGTIRSEESLKSIDSLYPYNHKLVIEGFPYSSGFIGEKKYTGSDTSAEFYCKKISLFDLESNNKGNKGLFATKRMGTVTGDSGVSALIGVVLKITPSYTDAANELCIVKWKTASDEINLKHIKLKAELETQRSELTPILYSYRVKLGA